MDCEKVGGLIRSLRLEQGWTQKQLAQRMHLSDRTISKWERGQGCPDVSLLHTLSNLFGVNIEQLLLGDLQPNSADGGNMKRMKFYYCASCGNLATATGGADISCCGRKLEVMIPQPADQAHALTVTDADDEWYITFPHEMLKDHYINFVACLGWDRVTVVRLYPEQGGELYMSKLRGGKLYYGCSQHGLWAHK